MTLSATISATAKAGMWQSALFALAGGFGWDFLGISEPLLCFGQQVELDLILILYVG